ELIDTVIRRNSIRIIATSQARLNGAPQGNFERLVVTGALPTSRAAARLMGERLARSPNSFTSREVFMRCTIALWVVLLCCSVGAPLAWSCGGPYDRCGGTAAAAAG